MSVNEEDYWPASMVNELKVLVRKEKFNFDSVSEGLSSWLRSEASLDSSKKSSFDINPKTCREAFARDYSKAPYNLNKKVPSPVKAHTEPAEEVKSQSSPGTSEQQKPTQGVVTLSADDEEEASMFNFDIVNSSNGEGQKEPPEKIESLSVKDGPDLTYEEVLENAERIEEENYRRKEEVFAKVAKLLMLDGYGEDEESAGGVDTFKPMNAMDAQVIRAFQEGRRKREEQKSKRKKQVAEAEEWRKIKEDRERLRRRFDEGSEDAEGEAYTFSPGAKGSGSNQANEDAEKALYEHYVRSMIGAAGAPSSSSGAEKLQELAGSKALQADSDSKEQVHQELYRQLIVDTIAAKYHGELSAVRNGTGVNTAAQEQTTSSSSIEEGLPSSPSQAAAPGGQEEPSSKARSGAKINLSGGFLESEEFEEILNSLEADQAATAQQKGRDAGDAEGSDLADVLAILDAAAAGKSSNAAGAGVGKIDDDSVAAMLREMTSLEDLNAVPRTSSTPGKVLLRAGMGAARRPEDISASTLLPTPPLPSQTTAPVPASSSLGGRMGASLQESKESTGGSRVLGAPRDARAAGRVRGGPEEAGDDDSESDDSDDDADSNWRNRRSAAKAKAAKGAAAGSGPAIIAGGAASGVYGFGGTGTSKPSRPKKGAGGGGVSIERSTDRTLPPPAPVPIRTGLPFSPVQSPGATVTAGEEESKGEATPIQESGTGGTSAPSSTGSSNSLTPDIGGTWSEVLTPPATATAPAGTNLAGEVDAEAAAEDISPVQVGDAMTVRSVGGCMLGGRSGGARSKGKVPVMKK